MTKTSRRSAEPAVSVVVPTYQRRELVRRSVESALAQTFGDFEVIVVDDGSTDGTERAVRGLDERVVYVRQEHAGVAAARNRGVEAAGAPLVAFLDSDELWRPRHLAVVTAALTRYPQAVLAVARPNATLGRSAGGQPHLVDLLPRLLLENAVGACSSVLARRDALEAAGRLDEDLPVGADLDLWLRLALVGPFSMVAQRTRLRQRRRDSLQAWGLRHHAYLDARERMLERMIVELERSAGTHRRLAGRARGMQRLCFALRCLREHRRSDAAAALQDACALVPELAVEYAVVVAHVRMAAAPGSEEVALFESVAALWPDSRATTAHVLRAWAALAALRSGDLSRARTLLADRELARSAAPAALPTARLVRRFVARELRHRLDHVEIAVRRAFA